MKNILQRFSYISFLLNLLVVNHLPPFSNLFWRTLYSNTHRTSKLLLSHFVNHEPVGHCKLLLSHFVNHQPFRHCKLHLSHFVNHQPIELCKLLLSYFVIHQPVVFCNSFCYTLKSLSLLDLRGIFCYLKAKNQETFMLLRFIILPTAKTR